MWPVVVDELLLLWAYQVFLVCLGLGLLGCTECSSLCCLACVLGLAVAASDLASSCFRALRSGLLLTWLLCLW